MEGTRTMASRTKRGASKKKRKVSKEAKLLQHREWGHHSSERLRETAQSDDVTGLEYHGPCDKRDCSCMEMNARKAPFKHAATTRSSVRGERIHSDVKEVGVASKKGAKYAVCFVDDCTRRGKTYCMERKSQVLEKWQQFLEEELLAKGFECKYFRSDNGGEYVGELAAFNNCRGIEPEYSPPHCQSGNGVAEVFWRETFKCVRALLWDQQRDHSWWAVALEFATYLRNRLITSAVADRPPEAAWTGGVVDTSHLRVPMCRCWSFIEKPNREIPRTLAPRRLAGVFVGYARNSPSYLVYDEDSKIVYSRRYADVQFDERQQPAKSREDGAVKEDFMDGLLAQWELDGARYRDNKKGLEDPKITDTHAGFVRTTRDRTVEQLAKLFAMASTDYLQFLRQYEGWYRDLKTVGTLIGKGSDVPVPTKKERLRYLAESREPEAQGHRLHKEKVTAEAAPKVAQPEKAQPQKATNTAPTESRSTARTKLSGISMSKGVRRSLRTKEGRERVELACSAILEDCQDREALWAQVEQVTRREARGWSHSEAAAAAHDTESQEPKHYRAARKRTDADKWTEAEGKEWNGLWEKQAFEDNIIKGQKLHFLMWVYKRKSDGTYKARLCLDGRRQDPDTYGDVRSPTMKLTSFRTLLSLSAIKGWDVYADDAAQAFLNAKRPEDKPMWASYPQGRTRSGHCLLLKKMLYGLHDAPAGWFEEVRAHLVDEQGLTQSLTDECLFFKEGLYVVCHVDDFCSTGDPELVKSYREKLYAKFSMTGGLISEYYGLNVVSKPGEHFASLSVSSYMERTMRKLGLAAKPYSTPMDADLVLPVPSKTVPVVAALQKRYRSLVGSAMHPAVTCRPDVAAAVRELSAYLTNPTQKHVEAAERVLQYLHHTRGMELEYRGGPEGQSETQFYGTCDAAHNVTADSKGITGWAYHLAGGAIAWKSKTQMLVALSSCEAELIAIDEAVRELRFLHKLLVDFGQQVTTQPTLVGQDNLGTIELCRSRHFNPRTRHVALRYHHVGDQQRLGVVRVAYLSTNEIPADALTKALRAEPFKKHRSVLLGQVPVTWEELQEQHGNVQTTYQGGAYEVSTAREGDGEDPFTQWVL
jgi:hypothetical protein